MTFSISYPAQPFFPIFILLAFLCLSSCPLSAQTDFFNPFKICDDAWKKNPENYLLPINALKQINTDGMGRFEKDMFLQAKMTYHSFSDFGGALGAVTDRYKTMGRSTDNLSIDTSFLGGYHLIDAKKEILKRADEHQIIMINEAHHIPYHRNFAAQLLPELYKKGFRYLALETMVHDSINMIGYPVFESGFYSREPLYAEMLRRAFQLGYYLKGYENTAKCEGDKNNKYYCNWFRDSMEAVNLIQILKKDRDAKILVYAGYSHVKEGTTERSRRLAYYLKKLTGIDPFTIDQTKMTEYDERAFENEKFRSLWEVRKSDEPVFLTKDDSLWSYTSRIDATIFHPRIKYKNDRPAFYSICDERKAYVLGKKFMKKNNFVQAFYRNEKGNRIPADQFFVNTGKENLYLFPGSYDLAIRNHTGNVVETIEIGVHKSQ